MDNVVSAMEFRKILESMLPDENERLRQSEQPSHPKFQLVDGIRKINVPDEGTIVLNSDKKTDKTFCGAVSSKKTILWMAG